MKPVASIFNRHSLNSATAALLSLLLFSSVLFTGCSFSKVETQTKPKEPVAAPTIEGEPGYHVIVAGGEPEGMAAALSAARNGMKTLLVEEADALGGLMTLGMLNFLDMNHGPKGELLTQGIFQEFYNDLGNAFDVEGAKQWFWDKAAAEPNLTVKLNTKILQPVMQDNTICGLVVEEAGQQKTYRSLTVIDATVDGDVAAAAGVPYTVGGEDYGEAGLLQGVTLVFEVSGVNWDEVVKYLKNDEDAGSGASQVAAWGYGKIAMQYKPTDSNMRFRGPNIAKQKNGNVLLNALLIFGVDSLDPQARAQGIQRGREEIPHIIEFMRQNFVGFEKAAFVDTAPRLYVRETRHILGEYRLTITDILENRDQWDRIGHGSYPVDVQPTSASNYGNVIGVPEIYSIPFRCLVPRDVEQLLVVGRSASYDSLAHGSARVIPVGMVTGEAAGVACAWATRHGDSFRQMINLKETAIPWMQQQLKAQGAYLVEYKPPEPKVMSHWAYPGVRTMRELGLTEGGYANDYGLDREISKWALQNKLNQLLELVHQRTGNIPLRKVEVPQQVTVGGLFQKVAYGASGQDMTLEAAQAYLVEMKILTEVILAHCPDMGAVPTYGQLLSLLGRLYDVLTAQ